MKNRMKGKDEFQESLLTMIASEESLKKDWNNSKDKRSDKIA